MLGSWFSSKTLPSLHREFYSRCGACQILHRQYSEQVKMGKVERITMFKIPYKEDRDRALEQYKVLKRAAVKVHL